jgi:hypothetical protein
MRFERKRNGNHYKRSIVMKVKTFTTPVTVFKAKNELSQLDEDVNRFIVESGAKRVVSVSDACTTDDTGATIGIIRVVTYE